MNPNQRQINYVYHEIPKRKANPNEYDGAVLYDTTRDLFKMRTRTTPNHHLDRLTPPAALVPIMTNSVSTSPGEFRHLQATAHIPERFRYPIVPTIANAMNSSTTEIFNTQPPDLPSQPLMRSSLTHFNGLQPNDSPLSQPYRYPTVHTMANTVNINSSLYPPSQRLLPSSLTHFSGRRLNNARTSLPYRNLAVPITTVNNSTAEPPAQSSSLDHFSSHQPNKVNDAPIMTNALSTSTAEVFNTQPLYPPSQPSRAPVTSDQPFVWRDVPITFRTKTKNTTTSALHNIQPLSPPSQSLPSPPSPPPLPPLSPQEEESMEAAVASFMQQFENKMMEDDSNQELLNGNWSPFHPMIATNDDQYQQQEINNIPPPVAVTLPSGSPTKSNPPNDQGLENIPPLILTTTSPSRSLARANSLIDLGSENNPLSVSVSSPSQSLDWRWPDSPNSAVLSPSLLLSPVQPTENNSSSPVLATSPSWNIADYLNSPTEMFYPTLVSSPTTGLFTNMN